MEGKKLCQRTDLLGRLDFCSGMFSYAGRMALDPVGGEKFGRGCLGVDKADEEPELLLGRWGWDVKVGKIIGYFGVDKETGAEKYLGVSGEQWVVQFSLLGRSG